MAFIAGNLSFGNEFVLDCILLLGIEFESFNEIEDKNKEIVHNKLNNSP